MVALGFLGEIIRKLVSYGAIPICGRYPWEFFPHAELIDPEDPVHTFVQQFYTHKVAWHDAPEGAVELIAELVDDYSIDSLIMLASRSCRLWNLGQPDMVDTIEKKCGVPGVIPDSDQIDSRLFSEARIDTRLAALFEMIDGRRSRRR